MPLDADVQAQLTLLAALDAPALSEGTIAEARHNYDAAPKPDLDHVARVDDIGVPGPAGELHVRLYADATDRELPVVVFFHGGGWWC